MNPQPATPGDRGRSPRRVLLDIALIVGIPSAIIYIISRIWN